MVTEAVRPGTPVTGSVAVTGLVGAFGLSAGADGNPDQYILDNARRFSATHYHAGTRLLVAAPLFHCWGLINGVLVSRLQVSPFIATLGSGLVLQGLLSASFTNFAGSVPIEFQALAYGALGPLPYSVIGLFLLAILASILMRATKFGAHLYAVGGNAEGARLAGIRTDLVTIGAHVLCSLTAGVSGLYLASRLRSGAPWVGRDGVYDLESIAVVVIGGTLLAGGRGGVWGTLAGVLLFAVLDASFNMLDVSAYPKLVLRGAIVIAAVAIYTFRSRDLAA